MENYRPEVFGGINLYSKINILFFVFSTLSMIFTILKASEEVFISSLLPFLVFELFFLIMFLIGDFNITRKIQTIFLFIISFFIISTNPVIYQVGYILLIFIYFLSKKYQIFIRNNFFIFIILFLLFSSIFLSVINFPIQETHETEETTIWLFLNQINFLVTTIFLIYIVFEDDIKRLTLENQQLNTQIGKSKVFVNLGENIAGLIHNMNGDIGIISMSLELLEGEVDNPSIKYIKNGNMRLQSKIQNILTLAKYSQNEDNIDFSLNALLHSLLEVFGINKTYGVINLKKTFQEELFFFGNTSEISQIFENLIKNIYEALVEKQKLEMSRDNPFFVPKLEVLLVREDQQSLISFIDNGPGIKACLEAGCEGNCSSCNVFKVGRTTKIEGTGIGMISVFRTLKKYKGSLKINTSTEGTEMKVFLPFYKHSVPVHQESL